MYAIRHRLSGEFRIVPISPNPDEMLKLAAEYAFDILVNDLSESMVKSATDEQLLELLGWEIVQINKRQQMILELKQNDISAWVTIPNP